MIVVVRYRYGPYENEIPVHNKLSPVEASLMRNSSLNKLVHDGPVCVLRTIKQICVP